MIEFVDHWYILCYAYKWEGETTKVVSIRDFVKYRPTITKDEKIVHGLWKLLDEADVVIAQNGDQFDLPKINTRFIQHNLQPPSPYKTVDTLKMARQFSFNSNKLDDLGRDLNEGRKVTHVGFPLWLRCHQGDEEAWKQMEWYNKKDVDLLVRIYKRLLPWIENQPNVGIYEREAADPMCPKCGALDMQFRGYQHNKTTRYRRLRCNACGGWSREARSVKLTQKPLVGL